MEKHVGIEEENRVRQLMHDAKVEIERVFAKLERRLFEGSAVPNSIYQQMEQFKGSLLSPMEVEELNAWLDQYHPDLIGQAIREAVFQNVRSVRYIDRILLNWEKAGVKDVQGAQAYSEQFRSRGAARFTNGPLSQTSPDVKKVPFYNWLEERD